MQRMTYCRTSQYIVFLQILSTSRARCNGWWHAIMQFANSVFVCQNAVIARFHALLSLCCKIMLILCSAMLRSPSVNWASAVCMLKVGMIIFLFFFRLRPTILMQMESERNITSAIQDMSVAEVRKSLAFMRKEWSKHSVMPSFRVVFA